MTSTIQFCMGIMLNILPKRMTSTIQFWMNLTFQNNPPRMDDHIHPTLGDYCSFCSLYKKSVSFSSKFGRISHITLKLPEVVENRQSFSSTFRTGLYMLKQDEPTRWNTTLHIIQYIIEQKMTLAVYSTEYDLVQLSSHQLDLANKIEAAFSPVEEITKSILANAASVSAIILFICMLQRSLEKYHNDIGYKP